MPTNAHSFDFLSLSQGFARPKLPAEEVFGDYVQHGGQMCAVELEACLHGLLVIDPRDHNIAARVLNEFFLGQPHCYLVAYATTHRHSHPIAEPRDPNRR